MTCQICTLWRHSFRSWSL